MIGRCSPSVLASKSLVRIAQHVHADDDDVLQQRKEWIIGWSHRTSDEQNTTQENDFTLGNGYEISSTEWFTLCYTSTRDTRWWILCSARFHIRFYGASITSLHTRKRAAKLWSGLINPTNRSLHNFQSPILLGFMGLWSSIVGAFSLHFKLQSTLLFSLFLPPLASHP